MEKFLGVLFCGGKGTRLGEITNFISKSFIPVYDKPVFMFGLNMLKESKLVDEIIVLTNLSNNEKFKEHGMTTLIQDDNIVSDMFSGWDYIKQVTGTEKNGVLVPSDNISNISIDHLIKTFDEKSLDFLFSVKKIESKNKLSQMGSFNPVERKYSYKGENNFEYGVIAPYIIRNSITSATNDGIFEMENSGFVNYDDYWFDIGDFDSMIEASAWRKNQISNLETVN